MYNLTKLELLWEWVNDLKKTVAENVKHLLPDTSTATTGQILKLTGETKTPSWADEYSYTPPAYSETEVNTGQKWIDGKYIYCKVYTGSFPVLTTTQSVTFDDNFTYNLISGKSGSFNTSGDLFLDRFYISKYSGGALQFNSVPIQYSETNYFAIVYYTKPDPAPETRDDDTEPETKKTTRKKTTK